jgi:O-antigen/teichoic acid export membrane protein
VNNVDYLIVGSVLGSYYLGLYTMAFVLGNLLAVVTQALADVAFPTLSLLKSDRARLLLVFDRGVLAISTVLGFMMLNMLILSPSMIPLLLSDRWASIVEPLMILTVFSAIRSLGILYAPILKALGRPDLVWKFAVIRLLVATPLLYWSATISIIAVGVCQVILVAAYLPLHWVLLRRLSDNAHQPLRLLTPMSLGLAVCGVAWAVLAEAGWLEFVNTRPAVAIAVALAMSVVYWSVIALACPQVVREGYRRLRAWQEQRRGGSSTPAAQTWSA